MIQPLRTMHRRAFIAMAAFVPAVFVLGIARRGPQLPVDRVSAERPGDGVKWSSGLLATEASTDAVIVYVRRPLQAPDPLLYCSPSAQPSADLPADSVLLGPVRDGARFAPGCPHGRLVLYSLGRHQIIDQLPAGRP